jgi:hypothetical protein
MLDSGMDTLKRCETLAGGKLEGKGSRHLGHLYHHLARGGGLIAFFPSDPIFPHFL